jgi:hypothetical protein
MEVIKSSCTTTEDSGVQLMSKLWFGADGCGGDNTELDDRPKPELVDDDPEPVPAPLPPVAAASVAADVALFSVNSTSRGGLIK